MIASRLHICMTFEFLAGTSFNDLFLLSCKINYLSIRTGPVNFFNNIVFVDSSDLKMQALSLLLLTLFKLFFSHIVAPRIVHLRVIEIKVNFGFKR